MNFYIRRKSPKFLRNLYIFDLGIEDGFNWSNIDIYNVSRARSPFPQKIQGLRDKVNVATESTNRQSELVESTMMKVRSLEDERAALEAKIHKLESELTSSELSRESLRRDKQTVTSNVPISWKQTHSIEKIKN